MKKWLSSLLLVFATSVGAIPRLSVYVHPNSLLSCVHYNDDLARDLFGPGYAFSFTYCVEPTASAPNILGVGARDNGDVMCTVVGHAENIIANSVLTICCENKNPVCKVFHCATPDTCIEE